MVTPGTILEAGGTEEITRAGGGRRYRKPLRSFRWCDLKVLLSESLDVWSRHNGSRLGASLAFYTLLSLTPLLLIIVAIGGLVFGRQAAQGQLLWQARHLVGPHGANAIQPLLDGARNTTHGILATVLGLLTFLFGASGVLIELRDALNTIWEVPDRQRRGWQMIAGLLRERLLSFGLVLAIGFLLIVSLAINTWIAAVGAFSVQYLSAFEGLLQVVDALVSFVVITGLFAAIYKILPAARIEWRDVVLGSTVTSLLFTLGKLLIGLYLGKASFASTYGAAASVVILIVWVYYSAQIFFFGAAFTKVFANRYGSPPHPSPQLVSSSSEQVKQDSTLEKGQCLTIL
jgi:membrane protein